MKIVSEQLKYDERGLIPAIVQDARTREVLTLAYMNEESLRKTLETKETWFWSRSRSSLWHKGETSGHYQRVLEVLPDCDRDALVILVEPLGPACHTGARSCFSDELEGAAAAQHVGEGADLGAVLQQLYLLIESRRRERPAGSYTTYLFDQGLDKILKKVGEEASETIIAAKNEDRAALTEESSDLLYHLVVMLVERGVTLAEVGDVLTKRKGKGR
ncbi:MAG TPA: bifunctional phosphoribosyl-AMP cyclohydrolase/phosphoribosyl-ATP diphosphatase HisIE [Pyrinomonadaceae bacterium]|jgi:phosphoribosyl-ATP pyrophosphohydrolase/phosphoribosyl-AMP cyclohydrolase